MVIREYKPEDIQEMMAIWNYVVEEGNAFPQEEKLDSESADAFFESQSYVGVAESDGRIIGLYILHPNNVGRCSHIANASYAVSSFCRGQGAGKNLVLDSLAMGRKLGFRILQFNAVVATNAAAHHLYGELGFVKLGVIPGGFRNADGDFDDIVLYYHEL